MQDKIKTIKEDKFIFRVCFCKEGNFYCSMSNSCFTCKDLIVNEPDPKYARKIAEQHASEFNSGVYGFSKLLDNN